MKTDCSAHDFVDTQAQHSLAHTHTHTLVQRGTVKKRQLHRHTHTHRSWPGLRWWHKKRGKGCCCCCCSFLFAKGVIVVKCWFIGLAKGLKRYMHFNGRRNERAQAKPTRRLRPVFLAHFIFSGSQLYLAIVKAYFLVLPLRLQAFY